MKKHQAYQAIIAGILAGAVLGFLLKIVQFYSGIKVYTLLLNIDYIPVIKTITFPEWIEFSFHIIVSVVISCLLQLIAQWRRWNGKEVFFNSILVSISIAIIIYPTTVLSIRTPSFSSSSAILLWVMGHFVYGVTLGGFLTLIPIKYHKFTEKSH